MSSNPLLAPPPSFLFLSSSPSPFPFSFLFPFLRICIWNQVITTMGSVKCHLNDWPLLAPQHWRPSGGWTRWKSSPASCAADSCWLCSVRPDHFVRSFLDLHLISVDFEDGFPTLIQMKFFQENFIFGVRIFIKIKIYSGTWFNVFKLSLRADTCI